jgi:hypothetical protein
MGSSSDRARIALAGIRIANGAAALVAPAYLASHVRAAREPDAAATYAFRLFGIRTVLIGADLLSRDPGVRAHAVRSALVIHGSDVVTAASLGLRGKVTPRSGVLLTAISAVNVLLAVGARRRRA